MLRTAINSLTLLLFLVAPLALPKPLFADLWYEHYAAAEKALSGEEWTLAIDQLNRALEKKGDPSARARTYGMKFTAYFPYLKLGIAYYHLGQLDAALQALETEERLGAIAESRGDLQELERHRGLIVEAQRAAVEAEAERIGGIVTDGLIEADRLEGEGRIEEAIAALGNALAVAPENTEAASALARLRQKLLEQQEAADRAQRVDALVVSARNSLNQGLFSEAASTLSQALSLEDRQEARTLLEEAQRRLRQELQEDEDDRSRAIVEGLDEARRLESASQFGEALTRLQSVLALDPENSAALSLQERVLAAQALARDPELDRARRDKIEGLLADTEAALSAGQFETGLGLANRVLALDAGNSTALEQLARAYRAINRNLLGGAPRQNFPPAIRFADFRQEREDGTFTEIVGSSDFRLSGVVIDDSPVELTFFDASGQSIQGSSSTQPLGDLYITEFGLAHTLAAGLTTLRLVATDTENATSSSEYAIVYTRPFFRSPWLYGLLASLLAVAFGIVWQRRTKLKKRLRQRRFNPYMAGAPVLDEGLFFGRQELLDRILQTLHNNSLLLHGERRIGKTTLQHQLKKRLESLEDPAYDFHPVYIDLQGTPEEKFFSTLAEEIFQELGPLLDGVEPTKSFSEDYSYRELVRDLRSVLKALRQRSNKRVRLVLLIDEVDELNYYDPRVNQKLRSLFMKSFAEDLVAVVSGVSIKREWDREGSPWYNFFEEIDVGPFRPDAARELIVQPIRGLFRLEDGVVERIIEFSNHRPYRIQKLCMKLVNHMYEVDRQVVTVADVEAIGSVMTGESA